MVGAALLPGARGRMACHERAFGAVRNARVLHWSTSMWWVPGVRWVPGAGADDLPTAGVSGSNVLLCVCLRHRCAIGLQAFRRVSGSLSPGRVAL